MNIEKPTNLTIQTSDGDTIKSYGETYLSIFSLIITLALAIVIGIKINKKVSNKNKTKKIMIYIIFICCIILLYKFLSITLDNWYCRSYIHILASHIKSY